MRRMMIAGLATATLAGCASPEPGSPESALLAEKHVQEAKADSVKETASDLPSWFLAPPKDDASIYSPGTATSADLQLAVDKATINAKRALADRVNSALSSKMKEFVSESGAGDDPQLQSESQRVTSNLITEVNLAGYNVTERAVQPQGVQYRAFVLLQYPLGSANRILVDQVKKNGLLESKLRASKAFEELEGDIKAAREKAN